MWTQSSRPQIIIVLAKFDTPAIFEVVFQNNTSSLRA